MKPSSDLFVLIKGMSPTEKRLFRLRTTEMRTKTGPNYLRIFDLIAEQTQYDEAKIKAQLAGEPVLRQFTRAKNYLYDRILRVLRQYHENSSAQARCLAVLEAVEVLSNRQLHHQAAKKLKSGLRIAAFYALTDQVPALLAWQRKLLKRQNVPKLSAALQQLEKAEAEAQRQLQREQQLRALYDRFLALSKQRRGPASLDQAATSAALRDLRAHPVLAFPPSNLPFNARLAHHLCFALYHRLRGEMVPAQARYREVRRTWEAHPRLLAAAPERYLRAVVAFLYSCHGIGQYDEFAPVLARIQEDTHLSGVDKALIRAMSYNLRLLFHLNQRSLRPGLLPAEELRQELAQPGLPLSVWIPGTINLALYDFILEDWARSAQGFRQVVDLPRGAESADLREMARLLLLVIYYELGHADLLMYAQRSMHRFVQKQRSLNPLEAAFRKFFRYVDRKPGVRDRADALHALKKDLSDAPSEELMGAEEVIIWVESRLRKLPMADVHTARKVD